MNASGRIFRPTAYHIMDFPLTALPQDPASTSSGANAAAVHRKQPVPVDASEGMTVMALEDIVPTLPNREVDTRAVTKSMKRKAWIQFAALCWSIFICGWNDGTTGPLIPRLQEVYHVCETSGRYQVVFCPDLPYRRYRTVSFPSYWWLAPSYVTTSTAVLRIKTYRDADKRHNGSRATSSEHQFISSSRNALDLVWYGNLLTFLIFSGADGKVAHPDV